MEFFELLRRRSKMALVSPAAAGCSLNLLGPPCYRSFFGRSFSGLRLLRIVGLTARTLFRVLVSVSVGGILLRRSPGPPLFPGKLLSLPASNRYFVGFCFGNHRIFSCSDICFWNWMQLVVVWKQLLLLVHIIQFYLLRVFGLNLFELLFEFNLLRIWDRWIGFPNTELVFENVFVISGWSLR